MDAYATSATITMGSSRSTPASELLLDLLTAFPEDKVSVGELLLRLESRALGLLLLIFALPMCIPLPPGTSTVFGALLIAPGIQLMFGKGKIWVPGPLARASISRETLSRTVNAAVPVLRRIEALLQPRICFVTAPPFTVFFGLQVLLMAGVLLLPIPGGNWPPGVSIAILALALLQRDGVFALLSTLLSALSLAIAVAASYYVTEFLADIGAFIGSMF